MQPILNIGIIGAGIGGLAAGALLAKDGHDVTLYDQFEAPKPVGSGLVIQPVGQDVLRSIGVLTDATAVGAPISRMAGHEAENMRPVLDVAYAPRHGLAIHRASLFNLLLKAARNAGVTLVPNRRATRIDAGNILFEDMKTATHDLVIDASGAGSDLSPIQAKPLPYGAIWGTVPWPETGLPKNELRQCYRRADRMMGVLPIGSVPGRKGAQTAIFWSLPADGHAAWCDAPLDHWKAEAEALWPDFAPFLQMITRHDQMTMARYGHGTLRKPYGERLAIIGDSAHKASPQLGQGANMALLDARALQLALQQAPVEEALPYYAKARRWHVRTYQAMSWAFTPQYQSDSKILPVLRDRMLFPASQTWPIPKVLTRLVCGDMLPPLGSLTPD